MIISVDLNMPEMCVYAYMPSTSLCVLLYIVCFITDDKMIDGIPESEPIPRCDTPKSSVLYMLMSL